MEDLTPVSLFWQPRIIWHYAAELNLSWRVGSETRILPRAVNGKHDSILVSAEFGSISVKPSLNRTTRKISEIPVATDHVHVWTYLDNAISSSGGASREDEYECCCSSW